ncbi:MAG: MASE3 domain-containing protein [Planctomycetota bacterium]|jgi:PAS domain S-box-containing protein
MGPGKKYYWSILLGISLLFGLWAASLHSEPLFHSIAEILSVVLAFSIFVLAWNWRAFLENTYLLFLGIACLFIGGMDLVHTLASKGTVIFQGHEANMSSQLWISARYIESVSLFIAPFVIGRKLKTNFVFLGYVIAASILLASIFYWNVFPVCYVEGVGPTTFKKLSEYIIAFALLASIVMLLRRRREFEPGILQLLIASITAKTASELVFTFQVGAEELSGLVGHYLKIVSFYLIYRAITKTGLAKPFASLFRELKQSQEALTAAEDNLEIQVNQRTAELQKSIEKLREAELRYRTVADFNYDWEYWENPDYTLNYVSPSCERITGYKTEDFADNPRLVAEIVLDEDRDVWEQHHGHALGEPKLREVQFRIRRKDGEIRWIEHGCQPVKSSEGRFLGFRVSNRDITERKRSEQALQTRTTALKKKEQSLSEAQRMAHLGSWDWNIVTNELSLSEEVYRILGRGPEDFDSTHDALLAFVHPDDRGRVKEAVNRSLENREAPYRIEYRIVRPDGSERIVRDQGAIMLNKDGEPIRMSGTIHDRTEHKRAEEELARSRDALSTLAGRLLSVQEEERRRLARELHDDLTQRLAIMAIEMGRLEEQLKSVPGSLAPKLKDIRERLVELSADVHDISRQLHPSIIDDLGLSHAIQSECVNFIRREGILIKYEPKDVPSKIPRDISVCLFRVVQEGLRNVAKHAKVQEAQVSLVGGDDSITLVIEDSGVGFNPTQPGGKAGLGLASMEERVRLIRGDFSIESEPGQGTVVKVVAPLSGN